VSRAAKVKDNGNSILSIQLNSEVPGEWTYSDCLYYIVLIALSVNVAN